MSFKVSKITSNVNLFSFHPNNLIQPRNLSTQLELPEKWVQKVCNA